MNCYNNSYNLHKLKFQWNYPTCNNCKVSNHVHSWLHGSFSTRGKLAPNALATSGGGSCMWFGLFFAITSRDPVSYTHLDVYKRQEYGCGSPEVPELDFSLFFSFSFVNSLLILSCQSSLTSYSKVHRRTYTRIEWWSTQNIILLHVPVLKYYCAKRICLKDLARYHNQCWFQVLQLYIFIKKETGNVLQNIWHLDIWLLNKQCS